MLCREDEAAAKLATDRVFLALVRAMDRPRECLQESQVNNIMPIQPKKKKVNKAAAVHDDEQVKSLYEMMKFSQISQWSGTFVYCGS